jgi:16S rRNA processing protein RimM
MSSPRRADSVHDGDVRRVVVGEFGRAHGVRGEIRLRSFTADPGGIAAYGALTTEAGRTLTIKGVRRAPGGAADMLIARVDGVADRDAAEALNGVRLYVARSQLPNLTAGGEFYQTDLVGLRVEDPRGRIVGAVTAVQDFGAGDLLEITPRDGGDSIYVAFTEAFVPIVDIAGGRVVVDAPDLFASPPEGA